MLANDMHQILQIEFENGNFSQLLRGSSPSDTPIFSLVKGFSSNKGIGTRKDKNKKM